LMVKTCTISTSSQAPFERGRRRLTWQLDHCETRLALLVGWCRSVGGEISIIGEVYIGCLGGLELVGSEVVSVYDQIFQFGRKPSLLGLVGRPRRGIFCEKRAAGVLGRVLLVFLDQTVYWVVVVITFTECRRFDSLSTVWCLVSAHC